METRKKVKIYMDGKEIGESVNQVGAQAEDERPIKTTFGPYSFTYTMSDDESEKMQWLLSRPERIKKYIKQIFRK